MMNMRHKYIISYYIVERMIIFSKENVKSKRIKDIILLFFSYSRHTICDCRLVYGSTMWMVYYIIYPICNNLSMMDLLLSKLIANKTKLLS